MAISLDKLDCAILAALQQDGRLSNVQLAEKIGLSESACSRRVRLLEDAGLIDGYVALLSQDKLGRPDNVFVQITLKSQDEADLQAFERAVQQVPGVMECYLMTGDTDYLLRVIVADARDYERLHTSYLTRLPGVNRVRSSFALRAVSKTTAIPLS